MVWLRSTLCHVAHQYAELAIYHDLDVEMSCQLFRCGDSPYGDPKSEDVSFQLVFAFSLRGFCFGDRLHLPPPSDIAD